MPTNPGWALLGVSLPALFWLGAWWLQNPGQEQWFNPLHPLSDNMLVHSFAHAFICLCVCVLAHLTAQVIPLAIC